MSWKHYYLVLGLAALVSVTLIGMPRAPANRSDTGISVSAGSYGAMETRADDGKPVALPLSATEVKAEVVGVMSAVTVTQHFSNPFKKPIEAVYTFPLPHHAAVHAMTMRLGQRVVRAVIKKRAEARAAYKRAREEGKTASILEQERPNVFTQSVANIMPGEKIDVELQYVEELLPRDGEYSFVFPMVVGPRYVSEAAGKGKSGTGWAEDSERVKDASRITPPLMEPGTRSGRDIAITLGLRAGVPLAGLQVVTHKASVRRSGADAAQIELDHADRMPNRDFVVHYRLAGGAPQATVLTSRDHRGGHLLLMVQPKRGPAAADLAPKEYVFVVDNSGSMDGDPITQVKTAMQLCLASMRPDDRFQIIRFASSAERFATAPLPNTAETQKKALAFVDTMAAGGGTEFLPALELALKAPRDSQRARVVLFMTDGYIGYESEVMAYVRANRGSASVFAFGVGSSVNRYLIDGLARIGGGEPFVLLGRAQENTEVQRFFRTVSRPSLTNLSVDWGGLDVSQLTPARLPDLFADKPITVAARFGKGGRAVVTLRGLLAGQPWEQKLPVTLPEAASASSSPALSYLWARRQLGEWADRHDSEAELRPALERNMTALALRYDLMSKFTSFVAVDQLVKNPGGLAGTHTVPNESPEGVGTAAAPPQAYVRGALSADQVMPGDPEVTISAPAGTRSVTLLFPTGEVKPCARDRLSGKWVASFLIPEGTPDGVHLIRVLIQLHSGQQLERVLRYQVDGAAPSVRVLLPVTAVAGEEVELRVEPAVLGQSPPPRADDVGDPSFAARVRQDLKSVQALLPSGEALELAPQPDGSYLGRFTAPPTPGRHPVVVLARDQARNKTRVVSSLEVVTR